VIRSVLVALLLAAPAIAAEEPEAVYAKFHQAGLTANLDGMRKYGTAAKGAEIASMPAALNQAMLKMLAAMLPKAYVVDRKSIDKDRATLNLSAKQDGGTVYGVVTLLREGGEWKVDEAKWGEPGPAAAKPAPVAQAKPAAIPQAAAQGSVNGVAFRVEKAELRNGILELRQGSDFFADRSFTIFLFLKGGESVDGKRYVVGNDEFGNPHVHLSYKVEGAGLPKTEMFMSKYRMTLEFGASKGGSIPVRIDLHTPDKANSFVSGTFAAEIK
jgi:hypothetical protein